MLKVKKESKLKSEKVNKVSGKKVKVESPAGSVNSSVNVGVNVPASAKLELPVFENLQVVRIMDDGHTKTHFHCYMKNGTTMHVPKRLFNN